MKLKIVYNVNIDKVNQVIDSFNTDFDCSFEKTEESDVFKIFIDDLTRTSYINHSFLYIVHAKRCFAAF